MPTTERVAWHPGARLFIPALVSLIPFYCGPTFEHFALVHMVLNTLTPVLRRLFGSDLKKASLAAA